MRITIRLMLLLSMLAFASGAYTGPASIPGKKLVLKPVFPDIKLQQPLAMLPAPVGVAGRQSDIFYIVEQAGRVLRLQADRPAEVFADLSLHVDNTPVEAGLLGMAFDPAFARNGRVYFSYTRQREDESGLESVVSRFVSRDAGHSIDMESEEVLLSQVQPYGNHNGGQIGFGPDGYLYIGLGDGGAGGDPQGNGQNRQSLLGAMLRIDVSGRKGYRLPADNPFVRGGGRAEIYAWGLRNPWRWSFDRDNGRLWLADVGQKAWEEINIIEKGGNYGWNIREGAHCYAAKQCRSQGLIDPVAEYANGQNCAITGGYVYRGKSVPALNGVYIYGDFCSGRIWGLYEDKNGGYRQKLLLDTEYNISSFAEDGYGEIYVIHHGGAVYKLAAAEE